ncbi:MAG: hypothetical protein FJ083_16955 [Cyanobacteria bacterium K_Offshore_surface_m2_239]|nr:hypothetical protein [Cyanobacteria bacterium K_Offshore_surface_m2_239]
MTPVRSPEAAPLGIAPPECGLRSLLETNDFSQWEAAVAQTLGHHRSELLSLREPFHAHLRAGALGGYGVVHLKGQGRLRLTRTQAATWVLWLPLQGLTEERINGTPWLSDPGTGLLFRSGEAMEGETSQELEGISLLIPPALQPGERGRRRRCWRAGQRCKRCWRARGGWQQRRRNAPSAPSTRRRPSAKRCAFGGSRAEGRAA